MGAGVRSPRFREELISKTGTPRLKIRVGKNFMALHAIQAVDFDGLHQEAVTGLKTLPTSVAGKSERAHKHEGSRPHTDSSLRKLPQCAQIQCG